MPLYILVNCCGLLLDSLLLLDHHYTIQHSLHPLNFGIFPSRLTQARSAHLPALKNGILQKGLTQARPAHLPTLKYVILSSRLTQARTAHLPSSSFLLTNHGSCEFLLLTLFYIYLLLINFQILTRTNLYLATLYQSC